MITKGENKYTFKQYARKEISNYLEGLFDNPSKHIPNFDNWITEFILLGHYWNNK